MTTDTVFERILVPTDFSDGSEAAWRLAESVARAVTAELVLLHVFVEAPLYAEGGPMSTDKTRGFYMAARAWVEQELKKWTAPVRAGGLVAREIIRVGAPHREIVGAATDEQASLIVIGTHGRGGVERALLGSVADRVIRTAPCPVLSVRSRE